MPGSNLTMVLLDLVLIMVAAKVFGRLAEKCGQPSVIGEITAGVLAGPTILGPHLSQVIFPADVRPTLSVLANIGVAAFMFIAGLELDRGIFTRRRTMIPAISAAAYIAPFALGCVVAIFALTRHHTTNTLPFALFIGCALAVTAFPVLARILQDRDLIQTSIGQLSLACAAVVDILAWIALAGVLAMVSPADTLWRWALLLPLAAVIWWVVRPGLSRLADAGTPHTVILLGLGGALLLGAVTEWIGLHLIFGAFAFGLIFPRSHRESAESGAHVMSSILLPAFFAVAGMSVNLTMVDTTGLAELLVIVVAAVGGKIGSVMLVGRMTGLQTRSAAALAALLNTRGLTELVILHVGLTVGLIGADLYSLLVVMALVTTAMTAPLLRRLGMFGTIGDVALLGLTSGESSNAARH
ncbi:cation:proton antiporter [Nocardia salmonicida]|uniref:cation:proton antiporter n=1 Tax=Nocardia salmonicida TaxID=53431 RepID=UPI0037A6C211